MSKKVLIRKQAGSGGIMYTREVGGGQPGGFRQDLAALRGGAMGLNPQGGQSFIPGAQLSGAAPTRMQRLGAGANLAGRGLAAALTGLQTAYGLQGGNVGALGNIADTYAQQAQGLTRNNPTEAQQTQNEATRQFNERAQQDLQSQVQASANQEMRRQRRAGEAQSVPLPTATSAPAAQLPPPAGLPAPPVPAQTPQEAPAQAAPAPAVDPTLPQALGGFGLENGQQTGTPLSPMQPQTPTGQNTVQTTLPPQPASLIPHQGTINPATGQPYPVLRSFIEQVLDEFGDMLHKADPHVAGLLAFRVYMDKVMR